MDKLQMLHEAVQMLENKYFEMSNAAQEKGNITATAIHTAQASAVGQVRLTIQGLMEEDVE